MWGVRERQIEDGESLARSASATDGDDLVSPGEIDSLDRHGHAQDLGVKRKREVVFEHRENATRCSDSP